MAEVQHFLRVASTDLVGAKPIYMALTKIKGIGRNYARALCHTLQLDPYKLAGLYTPEDTKKLEEALQKSPLPAWMHNRQKDRESGESPHLIGPDLKITLENELKLERRLRSYRGLRTAVGLTVRGQRTRSNFRRNKGKVVGVAKKALPGKK